MIKLHLTRKGQTTFPKPLREWLGVQPGGDVLAEFHDGKVTLRANASPAGMLARYARPKHKRFANVNADFVDCALAYSDPTGLPWSGSKLSS